MLNTFRYLRSEAQAFHRNASVRHPVSLEISAATIAGDIHKPNEDRFGVRGNSSILECIVLDGATSLKPIPSLAARDITGAEFASSEILGFWYELPLGCPGTRNLIKLNEFLRFQISALGDIDPDDARFVPATTASLVHVDSEQIRITNVSDSFILAKLRSGKILRCTPQASALDDKTIDRIVALAQERGITNREARYDTEIQHYLERERSEGHNRPGTSAVLNGAQKLSDIFEASFVTAEVSELFIGSDGSMPIDMDSPAPLFAMLEKSGLTGLMQHKKAVEDADPNWSIPRFKHSDDATGIWIRFG